VGVWNTSSLRAGVGNVVGRRNYRFFVGFVCSVTLLAAFVSSSAAWAVARASMVAADVPPPIGCGGAGSSAAAGMHLHDGHHNGAGRTDDDCQGPPSAVLAGIEQQPMALVLALYAGMLMFGPLGLSW
jgi:hypothetical protein